MVIKIVVDLIMIVSAIYMLTTGFANQTVQPIILILIGFVMLVEEVADLFHGH